MSKLPFGDAVHSQHTNTQTGTPSKSFTPRTHHTRFILMLVTCDVHSQTSDFLRGELGEICRATALARGSSLALCGCDYNLNGTRMDPFTAKVFITNP